MNLKVASLTFAAGVLIVRAADPVPAPKPPELQALLDAYTESLAPLESALAEKIKDRARKYAADLAALEPQIAGKGGGEALEVVRAEQMAYAGGKGTAGFVSKDKKAPAAALELRRAYDRDVAKLRADALPAARPIAASFLQKLSDLERKLISARNPDGVLATQALKREMQDALSDPLFGGDKAVVGDWGWIKFREDGTTTTTGVSKGKWFWASRSKRTIQVDFQQSWAKDIVYTLTPDGMGMTGKNSAGDATTAERSK
jgi:hypothetical protein